MGGETTKERKRSRREMIVDWPAQERATDRGPMEAISQKGRCDYVTEGDTGEVTVGNGEVGGQVKRDKMGLNHFRPSSGQKKLLESTLELL